MLLISCFLSVIQQHTYDPLHNPRGNAEKKVRQSNLPSDLLAIDIRETLYHFGVITGQVTNDELLGNIFANFCIGK